MACGEEEDEETLIQEHEVRRIMTALFIAFAVAVAGSYFALQRRFFLLAIGASIGWIALFAILKDNPPVGIAEGDPAQVILMLACIVLAVAVPLLTLGKHIETQRDQSGNFSLRETKTSFPRLFGSEEEDEEEKERRKRANMTMDQRNEEYRATMRSAFRRRGRR